MVSWLSIVGVGAIHVDPGEIRNIYHSLRPVISTLSL